MPLPVLQLWDKIMNWGGFREVLRELPKLEAVTFEPVIESESLKRRDGLAVRRAMEDIVRTRMPEMGTAGLLHF